jgi:hypothetical protein
VAGGCLGLRFATLAIRFGVILRRVWGGRRTWADARPQAILMSVGAERRAAAVLAPVARRDWLATPTCD